MAYAEGTDVPVEKSRAEIERIFGRYGASAFSSSWDTRGATIGFAIKGWHVRFSLPYPSPDERRFTRDVHGRPRPKDLVAKKYEAELRRLWRALALLLKAKLDCVESGITTFEREFLADLVLEGSGQTVGEMAIPRLEAAKGSSLRPGDVLPALPVGPAS